MRQLRPCLFLLIVSFALGLFAAPVHAQPSEEDHELGKELAIAGFDSYKAGAYEDALQSFQKASELYPTGQVLRMLGYTLVALEKWVPAADVLDQALHAELKPLPDELLGEVRSNLDKALSHVATVNIESDTDGATVVIDDGASESLPVENRRLPEGRHTFRASAAGEDDVEQEVELAGGASSTISLNFVSESPPPVTAPTPKPRKPQPADSDSGLLYPLGMAAGGAGLLMAGIGVATLVGGAALDESAEDRKSLYNTRYAGGCPPDEHALCTSDAAAINNQTDRAAAMQTAGLVLTIAGGAFLAGGIIMMALAPDGSTAADEGGSASLTCGPHGLVGLGCVGRF